MSAKVEFKLPVPEIKIGCLFQVEQIDCDGNVLWRSECFHNFITDAGLEMLNSYSLSQVMAYVGLHCGEEPFQYQLRGRPQPNDYFCLIGVDPTTGRATYDLGGPLWAVKSTNNLTAAVSPNPDQIVNSISPVYHGLKKVFEFQPYNESTDERWGLCNDHYGGDGEAYPIYYGPQYTKVALSPKKDVTDWTGLPQWY